VAEIESPSVFRIPGIRIDRGSVSLGVASHEIARSKDSRWIQVKGGPLDQSLIARIAHSEVRRLKGPRLDCRSAKCREPRHECGHVAEPQGGARVIDRRTRAAGGKESTLR
jgi:hypothetical protein